LKPLFHKKPAFPAERKIYPFQYMNIIPSKTEKGKRKSKKIIKKKAEISLGSL